jgi:hypothetical protein
MPVAVAFWLDSEGTKSEVISAESECRVLIGICNWFHLFLEQADGLPPVVKDSGGAEAAIHEGPVCLRQENSHPRFANWAFGGPNLV